jgi:hypothetical protein
MTRYLKHLFHADAAGEGSRRLPASDAYGQIWTSGKRMALRLGRVGFDVDLDARRIAVLLPGLGRRFEGALPVDLQACFSPEVLGTIRDLRTTVTAELTGEESVVRGWPCFGYRMMKSDAAHHVEQRGWLTTAVPWDWESLVEMLMAAEHILLMLDGQSLRQLRKLRGIPVYAELDAVVEGLRVRMTEELLVICEAEAFPSRLAGWQGLRTIDRMGSEEVQDRKSVV